MSSTALAPSDDIRVYQPSTRPGAPLLHAWIDDEDGRRRPVKVLVAPGRFLLIAGEDGQAWCEAARQLAAEADIPLDAVRIGHLDGDCHNPHRVSHLPSFRAPSAVLIPAEGAASLLILGTRHPFRIGFGSRCAGRNRRAPTGARTRARRRR
jgi:hypothetical protein